MSATDDYQLARAVQLVAGMVVANARCEPGPKAVGSEQGAVVGWDDVVVECRDGSYEHHQVKRQNSHFDERPAQRQPKKGSDKKEDGKPEFQELTELDNAFAALARWAAETDKPPTPGAPARPDRRFVLDLPATAVLIKKDLPVHHLEELCNICAKSTTTANGLDALRYPPENAQPGDDGDRVIQRMFDWLITWCGFRGASDIHRALSRLRIRTIGVAVEVEESTERTLETCFRPAADARLAIQHYLRDHGSPAGAATSEHLRTTLEPFRKALRWTLYHHCPRQGWRVASTHGSHPNAIERQKAVVAGLWSLQTGGELRVAAKRPSGPGDSLADRLARLAIHLPRGATARLHEVAGWRAWIEGQVGKTLGLDDHDLPDDWTNLDKEHDPDEVSELGARASDSMDPLRDEMDEHTWNKVRERVDTLREGWGDELRNATRETWYRWERDLSSRGFERHRFFAALMHPRAEGGRIRSDLRVGLRTADLLAEALALLLVVAAVLDAKRPGRESLEFGGQARKVRTLALKCWSGPAMDQIRVRGLDDQDGLGPLLTHEAADILVLSAIEVPVDPDEFMCDAKGRDSFGRAPSPRLVVTRDRTTRDHCQRGDLDGLRQYLIRRFEERLEAREQNIKAHSEDVQDAD